MSHIQTMTTAPIPVLPISAEELAGYCITSFDRMPPMVIDDDPEEVCGELTDEEYLYQSEMHARLKAELVKLYASILKKAHGTVSTVLLMEYVLAELEDLMSWNHPHDRCPFIDMTDALELALVNICDTDYRTIPTLCFKSVTDTLLDGQIGSFLLTRAYRRVGIKPDGNLIAGHDAFANGERLAVRQNVLDGYFSDLPRYSGLAY